MVHIKNSSAYNVQANPAEAAQTATAAHPSGHARSLTLAMLSQHSFNALNTKEAQGNEQEKMLARFAKEAISSGQLQISPNQLPNGIAQFEMQRNQGVLVIQAKLNGLSEYDVLGGGLKRGAEKPVSMMLPSPGGAAAHSAEPPSGLLGLPNESLLAIAGNSAEAGVNLNLRNVNRQMKAIGDALLSPRQRFVVENGAFLHDLDFTTEQITRLSYSNDDVKRFVKNNGEVLKNARFDGGDMVSLGQRTSTQRNFVLDNLAILKEAGYRGLHMVYFGDLAPTEQNSLLSHITELKDLGYIDWQMNDFARLNASRQRFVLRNGTALKEAGYSGHQMNMRAEE
ncbi:hypothetical protein [Serratia ficaria]|uniref:hypothetical protein n=1 Tax=Serratia ficaria TaxID=61651 RepID=UPI00077C777D|nr:hypothetical protein [Serratia ficaria]